MKYVPAEIDSLAPMLGAVKSTAPAAPRAMEVRRRSILQLSLTSSCRGEPCDGPPVRSTYSIVPCRYTGMHDDQLAAHSAEIQIPTASTTMSAPIAPPSPAGTKSLGPLTPST